MSNPFKTNLLADIYWNYQGVPTPDISAVPCTLVPCWEDGQAHGTRAVAGLMYTHMAHFEPTLDIRDRYVGAMGIDAVNVPIIYAPTGGGTIYDISFVERVNKGQRADHKIAYLNRRTPQWPTDNV
jgi:hypothetical protein